MKFKPIRSLTRQFLPTKVQWRMLFLALSLAAVLAPHSVHAQVTNAVSIWLGQDQVFAKWGHTPSKAVTIAAEQGDPNAMFALSSMYGIGDSDGLESAEALLWLTKAAEAGHPEAQVFLGYHFENAHPSDMAIASRWYRLAVGQGHTGGEYRFSLCYLQGKGVEKDEERGLELMRHAADHNHTYATMGLSDLYARGIGEPRNDHDTPLQLLLPLARLDFGPACDALVNRYRQGLGTDRDLVSAAKWYFHGAIVDRPGYPSANKILKILTAQSQQTDPFDVVLSLFLKALQKKDSGAMLRLGRMYAAGENAPKDPATAWQWFNLAARNGFGEAASERASIEKAMTAADLSAVKTGAGAFGKDLANLSSKLPTT